MTPTSQSHQRVPTQFNIILDVLVITFFFKENCSDISLSKKNADLEVAIKHFINYFPSRSHFWARLEHIQGPLQISFVFDNLQKTTKRGLQWFCKWVLHLCKLCKSSSQLGIYAEDSGFGKISSRATGAPLARAEYLADSRPTPWPPTPLASISRDLDISPAIWTYRRRCSSPPADLHTIASGRGLHVTAASRLDLQRTRPALQVTGAPGLSRTPSHQGSPYDR